MVDLKDAYEKAVLKRLESACVDRTENSECRHDPGLECAVRAHMHKIVAAVQGVHADRIGEYVDRIREQVCSSCQFVNSDGSCDVRRRVDCCLDRYLVLVVEAVEETARRLASENSR